MSIELEPDKKVRIEVTKSTCPLMKKGEVVYLNGPVIDYEKSGPVCVSALTSIYPWVMTARLGVKSGNLGYNEGYNLVCPDKLVEFRVTTEEG